jgi:nitrogen fixation protein NifQ
MEMQARATGFVRLPARASSTTAADTALEPAPDWAAAPLVGASPSAQGEQTLLRVARDPTDPLTLAFAGVIGRALAAGQCPLIRGLPESDFRRLLDTYFPATELKNGDPGRDAAALDELQDLLDLLLEFRREPSETLVWLSHAIASAAMRDNHLWQDMGLPNRPLLTRLMTEHFPELAKRNVGDMKWKKFFYRQLCERAEVPICKSPNCGDCVDYQVCFGHEHGST